jgi:hypothetical protein
MKSTWRDTATQRFTGAWGVLRGRPPKPDFGLLLVLPFLASAGGALAGLALESFLGRHRRRPAESAPAESAPAEAAHAEWAHGESSSAGRPGAVAVSAAFEARRTSRA